MLDDMVSVRPHSCLAASQLACYWRATHTFQTVHALPAAAGQGMHQVSCYRRVHAVSLCPVLHAARCPGRPCRPVQRFQRQAQILPCPRKGRTRYAARRPARPCRPAQSRTGARGGAASRPHPGRAARRAAGGARAPGRPRAGARPGAPAAARRGSPPAPFLGSQARRVRGRRCARRRSRPRASRPSGGARARPQCPSQAASEAAVWVSASR